MVRHPHKSPLAAMPVHRLVFGLQAMSCAAFLTAGASARAQEVASDTAGSEPAAIEELVVTGTRIRGVSAVGSQVLGIDAQEIRESGRANTVDLLRSVPQITNLGFDESRTNGAQRAIANLTGGSSINLRGLGAEATLVLVDGRRPLPGGGEGRWFDPNSIPSIALGRVEVVPDGSSAIYGSDAMTGVVNLITRRDFSGAETVLRYGDADGFDEKQAQALFGHDFNGRGNLLAAFEYYDRGNLTTADRPELYNDAGALAVPAFPLNFGPAAAPVAGFTDPNGNGILDPGEQTGSPVARQSNWLNVDALPKQRRRSAFISGDLNLTDAFRLYGEGYYSKRDFERNRTALTFTGTVPAANPYNRTGAPVAVNYSFINDLGPQTETGDQEVYQAVTGAAFNVGNRWAGDLFVSYGKVDDFRSRSGTHTTALAAAVNSASTTTAFNPFSNGTNGYASADVRRTVLDSIATFSNLNPTVRLLDTQLKFDGPLFALPAGDVRVAVGAERQDLKREQVELTNNVPSPNVSVVRTVVSPTVDREVTSAFAEIYVPIVGEDQSLPFVRTLSLAIAGRYDKYQDDQSNPGAKLLDTDTTNPKLGLTWVPVNGLTVRGTFGTSFRAPSLGDYSFGAPTRTAAAPISAAVAAAYGVPAQPLATNIQGGHTLGLTPEKSRTVSFGVDLAPPSLPGFNVTATYYKIKFTDQIAIPADTGSLQSTGVVNALVGATSSKVLPGLGFVIFNPTTAQLQAYLAHGGLATAHIGPPDATLYGSGSAPGPGQTNPVYVLIDSLSNNTGVLETDGIDFSIRYSLETGLGTWTFADTLTYVLKYDQALVSALPLSDFVNQVNFPLQFQTRAHVGWNRGHWSVNAFVNYQNAYDNGSGAARVGIGSYTTVDGNLTWNSGELGNEWLSDLSVSLHALNLLDEEPPFARVTQGAAIQNFDSQNASPVGRLLALQVSKRW
jgi:iron complex outermembrane recepter protein